MEITLLRSATLLVRYGGETFLVDPMLDPAGARPAINNTPNQRPNPLVELPDGWEELVDQATVVLVTHLHSDHFDATAKQVVKKDLPLLCQPEDVETIRDAGFSDLRPNEAQLRFGAITIDRTPGQHGTGEIGKLMAPVSGFVFHAPGEPVFYLAGDTIWCDDVANAISQYQPEVIVVNASGARFLVGDPIVMTADDIARTHEAAPEARIVVDHLESINHCLETRAFIANRLTELGAREAVTIPADGETICF
jgi:L-ascorbate metabolism protein UlaG (beta-lactamase superfamily)